MKSILKTKSMYQEMFGEVPPVIGFLGVDTNLQEFDKISQDYDTNFDAKEQVKLQITDAHEIYDRNVSGYPWMSKTNTHVLSLLRNDGAGQLRSSGRFIFEYNYERVKQSIQDMVDSISSATIPTSSDKWELDDARNRIQIYVVASLSGGTGCGTLMSFGYLLRELFAASHDIYAYTVLPATFRGCGNFVEANAYGAVLDIDYLRSNCSSANPYAMTVAGKTKYQTLQPYDLYYLVDNTNRYGTKYNTQDQIHTMLGRAFLALSGLMSTELASLNSNIAVDSSDGNFDHGDKKGWVVAHGLCELEIDTKRLKEIFCHKAALNLVSSILGGDIAAVNDDAMAWINTNNLCEHKADQLLNTLYDITQLPQSIIVANRSADAKDESDGWVMLKENDAQKKIKDAYEKKLNQTKSALAAKLNDVIANYGLNGAETFITALDAAFSKYESEMKEELVQLANEQPELKANISAIIEEWKSILFGAAGKCRQPLQEAQSNFLRNSVDTMRHNMAQTFYSIMRVELTTLKQKVNAAIAKFASVSATLTTKATALNVQKNTNPFVIDLSAEISLNENHSDNTLSRFLTVYPDILGAASLTAQEVIQKLMDFAASLDGADFKDVSIEQHLLNLPSETVKELFEDAVKKAEVLLDVRPHGSQILAKNHVYVSLPSGANSALLQRSEVTETIKATAHAEGGLNPVASPVPNKIMIYMVSGAYPVFQIDTVAKQKDKYEKALSNKCFSFDVTLEQKIKDEHFSFEPNQTRNDDLLELWVKGFIFDLIRKDGNGYVVKSSQLATSLTGLYSLKFPSGGIGTERRAYAFEDFQDHKITFQGKGEIKNMIRDLEMSLGKTELTKKYEEYAKMANDAPEEYLKKFAGVALATVDNNNPNYEKTRTLLSDELNYCKTQLVKSIDSIF